MNKKQLIEMIKTNLKYGKNIKAINSRSKLELQKLYNEAISLGLQKTEGQKILEDIRTYVDIQKISDDEKLSVSEKMSKIREVLK